MSHQGSKRRSWHTTSRGRSCSIPCGISGGECRRIYESRCQQDGHREAHRSVRWPFRHAAMGVLLARLSSIAVDVYVLQRPSHPADSLPFFSARTWRPIRPFSWGSDSLCVPVCPCVSICIYVCLRVCVCVRARVSSEKKTSKCSGKSIKYICRGRGKYEMQWRSDDLKLYISGAR